MTQNSPVPRCSGYVPVKSHHSPCMNQRHWQGYEVARFLFWLIILVLQLDQQHGCEIIFKDEGDALIYEAKLSISPLSWDSKSPFWTWVIAVGDQCSFRACPLLQLLSEVCLEWWRR